MFQVSEDDKDARVFVRAKQRNQTTFTLVAQDETSPKSIMFWIMENIETAPDEKLRDAFERAIAMRKHPARKRAD